MAPITTAKDGVFTYHILQDRERKNLAILELVRKKGPISRADISRSLGYNIVTVTNYTDYYIDKRIILEVGLDVSSGGRRPELLELNAKSAYVVGVDLGPATISALVADLRVKTIAKSVIPRPVGRMEDLIPQVVNVIEDVIKKSGVDPMAVKSIGMGISGIVDYSSGTIRDTDPQRGRTRVTFLKFAKAVEDKFNIPVYIGNDATCASFGEKTINPSADVDNMIYLYSDVGSGMIVQGDVYIGSSGCAGETQLAFSQPQTDEGAYIEEYAHLRPWGVDLGVVAMAKKAIASGAKTEILALAKGDEAKITKDVVVTAAEKNDKVAVDILAKAGTNLGTKIAYMVNVFNPSVVVIGGGMEKAGDLLLEPVKAAIRKFSFEEPAGVVKVIPSLIGDEAVVLGSAALAAREIFIRA
jgi:predicted NBD/HSP70 family sugar kinase